MDIFTKRAEYIVAAYAYFERRMREICEQRTGISGPLDAAEARKLIHRHAPMKLPDGKLWQELMMLKKIRNVLLSSAGRLEERSLLTYALKRGIVGETGGIHRVQISEAYKKAVREMVIGFFDQLASHDLTHSH